MELTKSFFDNRITIIQYMLLHRTLDIGQELKWQSLPIFESHQFLRNGINASSTIHPNIKIQGLCLRLWVKTDYLMLSKTPCG